MLKRGGKNIHYKKFFFTSNGMHSLQSGKKSAYKNNLRNKRQSKVDLLRPFSARQLQYAYQWMYQCPRKKEQPFRHPLVAALYFVDDRLSEFFFVPLGPLKRGPFCTGGTKNILSYFSQGVAEIDFGVVEFCVPFPISCTCFEFISLYKFCFFTFQ